MHLTHRNLVGVALRAVARRRRVRRRTWAPAAHPGKFRRHRTPWAGLRSHRQRDCLRWTCPRAPAPRALTCRIALERRGRLAVDRITTVHLISVRPVSRLDLRAPAVRVLAWPVPRGWREAPAEAASGGNATAVHRLGDEEWAGLREFRSGDSPRQVAWGAYARGRGLLVKTYQSPAAHQRTVRSGVGTWGARTAPRTTVGLDRGRTCSRRTLRSAARRAGSGRRTVATNIARAASTAWRCTAAVNHP